MLMLFHIGKLKIKNKMKGPYKFQNILSNALQNKSLISKKEKGKKFKTSKI